MKKERKLSAEERILWSTVAKTAKPLPGRLEDLLAFEDSFDTEIGDRGAPAGSSGTPPAAVIPQEGQKRPKGVHQPLERPVKRKIARGRLPLEARIDLHGMFQSEAHGVLLDFLMRAHERGLRHVLVITGKGSSLGSEGALKRAVPMWFAKPEFRFLISSYEPAARHHGGEGALYVRLSRRGGET
ncbi:Smr/MutS family protein [Rhizobium sp. SSA_523]|uniref:Smr/MutS family protein n=1 Tax=Rhizobium sp. SSA_523 TaxID=2952477 RepID=UPI002090AF30|nr:Smr/MutS family protein [Rhizobium sp. SSA_523]MCO5734629.1 Smr/MutS family protein [Rhizobium sp. SSA_523]WKC23402.1 Smr/MutS family protein [Rhizobium sp. SSA_523]